MNVRVRYAPSPTGLQHIGGARTALFNYFFARSQSGTFILRIEDTDRERYSEEALGDIYETLAWLGIQWDEGPYIQSERFDMYREYAQRLVDQDNAYHCFCSPERLEQVRQQQSKEKKSVVGYDRHCRDLTEEQREAYRSEGRSSVIRFKIPLEGETELHDRLLGTISRKNRDINPDPVLLKSDGYPTYHLANVVDDSLMKITHILRAQEWISSGPLHVLLYNAFGWEPPVYCHLPMVMGKDGQKLSKRHGATSIREFRKIGYLPEAVINYVSLVGWSYDDKRQFFSKQEFESLFCLDKLNKAPGVFDYKKLEWFNGQYIREKTDAELNDLILPYLIESGLISDPPTEEESRVLHGAIPLIKERLRYLSEAPELVRFLFKEISAPEAEQLIPKKMDAQEALRVAKEVHSLLTNFDAFSDEENEERFRNKAEELEVKLGSLLMPLRVAVTGSSVSPPLFGSIRLLGTKKAIQRLDRAIQILENHGDTK